MLFLETNANQQYSINNSTIWTIWYGSYDIELWIYGIVYYWLSGFDSSCSQRSLHRLWIIVKILFSDSDDENQNSDTTNSDEDSDGLEIRLDFQPIPIAIPRKYCISRSAIQRLFRIAYFRGSSFWHMKI